MTRFAGMLLSICVAAAAAAAQIQPAPSAALTDEQRQALQKLDEEGKAKMPAIAMKIANAAKALDRSLLSETPNPELEGKLTNELGESITDVIRLRVASVRSIIKILTPEQKKLLLAELEKPNANPDIPELMKKVFGDKR